VVACAGAKVKNRSGRYNFRADGRLEDKMSIPTQTKVEQGAEVCFNEKLFQSLSRASSRYCPQRKVMETRLSLPLVNSITITSSDRPSSVTDFRTVTKVATIQKVGRYR
jgi:hypothetical protein